MEDPEEAEKDWLRDDLRRTLYVDAEWLPEGGLRVWRGARELGEYRFDSLKTNFDEVVRTIRALLTPTAQQREILVALDRGVVFSLPRITGSPWARSDGGTEVDPQAMRELCSDGFIMWPPGNHAPSEASLTDKGVAEARRGTADDTRDLARH